MERIKNMNRKAVFWKIMFTFMFAFFVTAAYCMHIPCIYKTLFGIPCPGCGMTRAVLSALRLDFKSAFSYHPMFFTLPVCWLYIMFDGKFFNIVWLDRLVLIAVALGFAISYIFKIAA